MNFRFMEILSAGISLLYLTIVHNKYIAYATVIIDCLLLIYLHDHGA